MSDYLFAQPSFLTGIARSVDLGGVFDSYNESATPEQADARAARADWKAVGREMRSAIDRVKDEASTPEPRK